MEVIGDGDHEQSFLVPRFERAKRGRGGRFSTVTFNSDNAILFLFPCHPLHIHTSKHLAGYTPKHHHLSPSHLQVQGPLVRSREKNLKGDLKRPTVGSSTRNVCERETRRGKEK